MKFTLKNQLRRCAWRLIAFQFIAAARADDAPTLPPNWTLKPGTEKGKCSDWTETQKQRDPHPFQYQDYIGIPNQPGRVFLVVLRPAKPGAPALKIQDVGGAGRSALEITDSTRTDRIELHADFVGPQICSLKSGRHAPKSAAPRISPFPRGSFWNNGKFMPSKRPLGKNGRERCVSMAYYAAETQPARERCNLAPLPAGKRAAVQTF